MQAVVLLSGIAGIVFAQLRWPVLKVILACCIFILVTMMYVARLFGVPPLNFEMILGFVSYVRPLRSPEYAVAGVALAVIPIVLCFVVPKVSRFTNRTQYLFAALMVGMFVVIDTAVPPVKVVGLQPPRPGQPVDAASRQVGLWTNANDGHHVLVIVVEALGMPRYQAERTLFNKDWDRPEWGGRYEVTTGTNRYAGSTTFGELRELCGISANYKNYDFNKLTCLPDGFAERGYETTAIHAFEPAFFGRSGWYPQIGFQNMLFRKDLLAKNVRECPGIFPGACDTDIARVIAERIKSADRPQFVYWLTLNTHTPVISDQALGTERCTLGSDAWRSEFPAICRLYELHHRLAESVSRLVMDPDLPPTDILIVGDHKPFIFDRQSNLRFVPNKVPWIYLRAVTGH